jgi:hypothetical protein
LLKELHSRSHGVPAPVRAVAPEVRRPQPIRMQPRQQADEAPREVSPVVRWMREHYPKLLAAVVVLAAGVATMAWLSQSASTPASRPLPPISSTPSETPAPVTLTSEAAPAVTPVTRLSRLLTPGRRRRRGRRRHDQRSLAVPRRFRRQAAVRGGASPGLIEPIQSQDAARGVGPSAPVLAARPGACHRRTNLLGGRC